ncbi:EamA-like transporter family protein [Plasticicumulans lactativorans]|uniref:EamA-like transporter family protein n=1 Tax=Plasticicumulans lactativorans TaxID=1133106 RepID=A0A4R2L296_9GAMM|nr:DMT family transporter [Plasticicumulans lactativorans]TCO81194.1 EamA-like transporter family protein [Plasticicumulans lactativorans]
MPAPSRPLGIAALLVATSAWGSLFLVSKDLLAHLDPAWFTLLRYTIATLTFALLLARRGALPWARLRAHLRPLALYGFVGYGVFSMLLLHGLRHTLPAHGAVIMATMPLTTQLLRWRIDGIRPSRTLLLSALLALCGVAVVAGLFAGAAGGGLATLAGDLTILAGTLGWVWYTRGSAALPAFDALEYTTLTALAAWPLLLLATLLGTAAGIAGAPTTATLGAAWPALLYIGLVPTVIAIVSFNVGVRALGAVTGTAFINVVPLSALAMSVARGATPAPHELLGTAIVIGALLLHTALQLRRPPAVVPLAPASRSCPA